MPLLLDDDQITYAEHALDIVERAVELSADGQPTALVMSTAIEGGAARNVGALSVVDQTGQMTGYLSNGCIDRDIILQAQDALTTGKVKQIRYGAGSPFMDLRLPCGGALELVIDPNPNQEALLAARDALRARTTACLSACPERGILMPGEGAIDVFYAPKPRLILAGRGPILRSTAALAAEMDFDLHVYSPDAMDLSNLERVAPAGMTQLTAPHVPVELPIDTHSAVLLLFHDHEWELKILETAARANPFFIGAMGSMRTQANRLMALREAGLSEQELGKIVGPIGFVPSLRNASLISVSALAQITNELPQSQWNKPIETSPRKAG